MSSNGNGNNPYTSSTNRLKFLIVVSWLGIDLIGTSNRPYYWIQFIQMLFSFLSVTEIEAQTRAKSVVQYSADRGLIAIELLL